MKVCLAENIRMLRKERGLTQEQLAEAMGMSLEAKVDRGRLTIELRSHQS